MEWPETIYNKQEMTWNDLQWARNDLKQPTMSKKLCEQPRARKKRHRTAYCEQETTWNSHNKQGTTWNDLQRTDSNFMEPLIWKILTGRLRCHKEAIDQFRVCNILYHLCICKMMAEKSKQMSKPNEAKQKKTLNSNLIS